MYLLGIEFNIQMKANADFILGLDSDSLLRNFRSNAGLDIQDATPLQGWEDPKHHFRGHFMGHFMSALSKSYVTQATDPQFSARFL